MITLTMKRSSTETALLPERGDELGTMLCLHYEFSAQRTYLVWLLLEQVDKPEDYAMALRRSAHHEQKQPLLIDLRAQCAFYRVPFTPSGQLVAHRFAHDTLCRQLTHYLLRETQTNLSANHYYLTSLAGNLTACLIKSLDQPSQDSVGITPYQLKQIERYTQDHMDRLVTLDELAAVVRLSSFHFARQFKRTTGESPYQYVIRLKMQHAKMQLLNTEASVINVGMQVGYENPSQFSRAFKRNMGVSPTQLRKTLQEEPIKLSA